MKRYWWILDEWGCMNFFDSVEAFRHARSHVHGLMESDTYNFGDFQAENVKGCYPLEEILKWKDGLIKED